MSTRPSNTTSGSTRGSVGIDVGGTFTDVVYSDGGQTLRAKAPTDPADFGRGALEALTKLAASSDQSLEQLLAQVERIGLGTTAVTNVVTALMGAEVGLVTTAGFEEELLLARGIRPSTPEGRVVAPLATTIAPRLNILGVPERIDRSGRVVTPLDETAAVEAARVLVEERSVDAVVISFVNSYRNVVHEEQATQAIRAAFPGVDVISAAELSPTHGFFQRTLFGALNGFSSGSLDGIDAFVTDVREKGLEGPLRLVNATGGTIGVPAAKRVPMVLMHSGPSAGVAAANSVAASLGLGKAVACDMGGTSFDVSLIHHGVPLRRLNAEILGAPTAMSVVDVESIGSGGGSLGWVDSRRMLRVGPQSARALPGPACYGRGGEEPTVTDALVVLGYLDPDHFLGGTMKLDAAAAHRACARLGERVGLTAQQTAWGIRRLALTDMISAVRLLSNRRGVDVRDYAIISYGGSGSLFTADIAAALGIDTVVVAEVASVLSAYGAASAGVRHERSRSLAMALPLDHGLFDRTLKELREAVESDLDEDNVAAGDRDVWFEADFSFKRQKFQVSVRVPEAETTQEVLDKLVEDFHAEYTSRYGEGSILLGAALELVTVRAIGQALSDGAGFRELPKAVLPETSIDLAPRGTRPVMLQEGSTGQEVPVFLGADLVPGARIVGPACVDKIDTTIWMPAGSTAVVDSNGSLVVTIGSASERAADTAAVQDADTAAPVMTELLRAQLQAVVDEAADTVERTAISPIVTEGQDYGAAIMDAEGNLLAGGGKSKFHWIGATRAVRATLAKFGDAVADGDVYLANDPHNGGGMHASDVMVQRPIFADGQLVGWSALSAHLMDMGGMAVGSWATDATDCFQEAFRIPPVRLIRKGEESTDIWDLFRTNVRFAELVEMDLRGLIAGSYVAMKKLQDVVVASGGADVFCHRVDALIEGTADALLARIRQLEPGTYSSTGWTEWGDKFVATPCTLTVTPDKLIFDFDGADEQIPFFVNSKPYIISALFMPMLTALLAPELPFNEGLLRHIEMRCPEGTVVNCLPPAPSTCGHMHLGQTAAETMNQCVRLATYASPVVQETTEFAGYDCQGAHSPNSYWGQSHDGAMEVFMMLEGLMIGQSASPGRDGIDYTERPIDLPGNDATQVTPLDVESYETWYPILMHERSLMAGTYGAGRWRSGGSLTYTFEPWETDEIGGQMLGYRGYLPLPGVAGGRPGAVATFTIISADGSRRPIAMNQSGVVIKPGERFVLTNCSGGGWGDPLERDPNAVAEDVREGRYDAQGARTAYGVVLVDGKTDADATAAERARQRRDRLSRAIPPAKPAEDVPDLDTQADTLPLHVGVVESGGVAYARESGAALAVLPGLWTDGCAVLDETEPGSSVAVRTYLDPRTGVALHTDVTPREIGLSSSTNPARHHSLSAPRKN